MRFLIAGSSGFLGSHLVRHLRASGHRVTPLVRQQPGPEEAQWDPDAGELDTDVLSDVDVVVNLAGSPTVGNPWSRRWARELLASRVRTTTLLAEAIAAHPRPPAFLAGNGISVYGDHGPEPVAETSESRGTALLAEVTRQWEQATAPATAAGARVCVLRTAPVLDREASPLRQLRALFRAGLGARLGPGSQYFPIISLRDWVAAVAFLAESQDLDGAFNLTCPRPPTNAEFTRALAAAVHRRAFLVAPAPVLRVGLGKMAPELLNSVNARPEALLKAGFDFRDDDVHEVLAAGLSAAR